MPVQCKHCDWKGNSPSSLRSHLSRKHPEHKKNKSLPKVKCTKRKLYLGKKKLTKENASIYRQYLTEELVSSLDGLSPALVVNEHEVFNALKSTLRLVCPENVYHLVCLDPELVNSITFVKEILPIQCKCFCNLLKDHDDPISHIEDVLDHMEDFFHYHSLIILEDGHNERTVQSHFNAVYGNNQYRLIKINDVNHYVNAFLYIAGRQCSKKINTHIDHNTGYYLQPHQKANIYRQLAPMIPVPNTDESKRKKKRFHKKQEIMMGHPVQLCKLPDDEFVKLQALRAKFDFDL